MLVRQCFHDLHRIRRCHTQLGEKTDIVRFNGETKVGDPQNWRADISLLKKIGYEKKMDLTEGIRDYVSWVKQQA